jgi:hypothetical protein
VKAVLALGVVIFFGFVGYKVSDPMFDAGARSICSSYAAEHGLTLMDANGQLAGRRAFQNFSVYSCTFTDSLGSTVFVEEKDRLISPTWEYRGLRTLGWLAMTASLAAGVGLSSAMGLLERD